MHFILSLDLGLMLLGFIGAGCGLFALSMFRTWREGDSVFDALMELSDDLVINDIPWLSFFLIFLAFVLPVGFLIGIIFAGSNSLLLPFLIAAGSAVILKLLLTLAITGC